MIKIIFGYSQPPPAAHIPPGSTYAPGMSVLAESHAGKRIQAQGHPLKSFTVPAPPPISAPGTPQPKHIGIFNDGLINIIAWSKLFYYMKLSIIFGNSNGILLILMSALL